MMSQQTYAQILKDRGKLKTVKSDGGGFILFGRKIKTESPSKKNKKKQKVKARFSSNTGRTKRNNVRPVFSTPLFGSRIKSVSPRFSKKRFVGGNSNVAPRYTPKKGRVKVKGGKGWNSPKRPAPVVLANNPKYSAKPKKQRKYGVSPRFSPARTKPLVLKNSPRYSAKPKKKKALGFSPLYSEHRGKVIKLAETPRYSAGPGKRKKAVISPLYSNAKKESVIEPYPVRYSVVGKKGKKAKVSPLFSDQTKRNYKIIYKPGFNVFDYLLAIPGGIILAVRPHDEAIAQFKGWLKKKDVDRKSTSNSNFQGNDKRNIKIVKNFNNKRRAKNLQTYNGDFKRKTAFFEKMADKKRSNRYSDIVVPSGYNKRRKSMHPSAVNLTMKKATTKTGKEIIKKASKFWTKVDGNKNQPPNVRGRTKKLKFDKKEKGLWYE